MKLRKALGRKLSVLAVITLGSVVGCAATSTAPATKGCPTPSSSTLQSSSPTPTSTSSSPTPTSTGTSAEGYVLPNSVGYLGATSALTVYKPGGAAPTNCAWQSYGLRCNDNNVTLDHVLIQGGVYWTGTGVMTVTNSVIQGGSGSEWYVLLGHPSSSGALPGSKIVVKDSTLNWLPGKIFPTNQDVAPIWSLYGNQAVDAERDNLSGLPQGLPAPAGSTLINNWVHDLVQNSTTSTPTHLDGIFSQGGSNILIQGNYVDAPARSDTTAAMFIQGDAADTNIAIKNNFFNGGAYNLVNDTAQNVDVENNTFGSSIYGFVAASGGTVQGTYGTWSGNISSTGSTISKP